MDYIQIESWIDRQIEIYIDYRQIERWIDKQSKISKFKNIYPKLQVIHLKVYYRNSQVVRQRQIEYKYGLQIDRKIEIHIWIIYRQKGGQINNR